MDKGSIPVIPSVDKNRIESMLHDAKGDTEAQSFLVLLNYILHSITHLFQILIVKLTIAQKIIAGYKSKTFPRVYRFDVQTQHSTYNSTHKNNIRCFKKVL